MSYVTPPDNLTDAIVALGTPKPSPMPRYRCHKEVSAFKIGAIERLEGIVRLAGEGQIVEVSEAWVAKHSPGKDEWTLTLMLGGYFVLYDDGYQSFSPDSAFESGYTRI